MARREPLRVLVVGAEATIGGVAEYVSALAGLPALSAFDWHMTCRDITACSSDSRFERFSFHAQEVDFGWSTLPAQVVSFGELIRRERFDLLHLHTARAGLLGALAAVGDPVAVVYSGHGLRFEQKAGAIERQLFLQLERLICLRADRVTFLTERDQEIAVENGVVRSPTCVTIRTHIDPQRFEGITSQEMREVRLELGIPEGALVFGGVGRLEDRKDPLTFVRAASLISREIPESWFLWIGDGGLRRETNRLADELGIGDRFVVSGVKLGREMPYHVGQLDVFLCTSKAEGVPLSVLEAIAAGVPVVCAEYAGVEALLRHLESALLFPVGDAVQAAEQAVRLSRDPDLAERLRSGANRLLSDRHADPAQMGVEFERVFREAIAVRDGG